ncbi:MAG: hypothetical protein SOY57_06770 [Ruminococcus bromii]|nr:hypothetical protein [Ruminococcus bromii]
MDNKITVKVENEKFEVLHFPRIKLIWYGEYLEIMALKPKRKKEIRKTNKKKDIIVNTDELVHTARSSSACFPVFQCTLSAA